MLRKTHTVLVDIKWVMQRKFQWLKRSSIFDMGTEMPGSIPGRCIERITYIFLKVKALRIKPVSNA